MYLDISDQTIAGTAERLSGVIEKLQGELNAAVNPHRLALRQLGVGDNLNGAREPYNDEAFKSWYDLLRRDANDLETVHHIAIMHHARAIDREAGKDPREADADWEAALKFWGRLWQSDVFWERIVSRIPGAEHASGLATLKETVGKVREQFPVLFLRIHYAIAFDPKHTKTHRAKHHIKLAEGSSFPAKAKQAAQRETYAEFVKNLPAAIWQLNMLDPATIKIGTDRIEKYLELDPTCLPALEDALRLQIRLIRAWSTDLMALGEGKEAERKAKLELMRKSADYWVPFFQKMAEAPELDDESRQSLGMWFRIAGDVYCAMDMRSKALSTYELGVKATRPGMDEHKRCRVELGRTHTYVARELANKQEPGARSCCDQVAKRDDLDTLAFFLLGNAYNMLHEFDLAEQICRRGLALEQDYASMDELEQAEQGKKRLQDLLDDIQKARKAYASHQLVEKAMKHLEAQKPELAVPILDQAIVAYPDGAGAYIYRCQCRLLLNQIASAREDLTKFKSLAGEANRETVAQMEQKISESEGLVRKFGEAGVKLRRLAIESHNQSNFEVAAGHLRKALERCPSAGKADLGEELAIVLKDWSLSSVNSILEDKNASDAQKKQVCQDGLARLKEAARLDPKNPAVKQNLDALSDLVNNIDRMLESAKVKAQLLADYGNEEALEAQQKAVQAFNEGRHDQAIKFLRKAVDLSGRRPKLCAELAHVLLMVAVKKVNDDSPNPSAKVINAAEALLQDAAKLDPNNSQIKENLLVITKMKYGI